MKRSSWCALIALALIAVLSGLFFSWKLLQAMQFGNATIVFCFVVLLLTVLAFGQAGALRRISARVLGSGLDVEFYEQMTKQDLLKGVPGEDREEFLRRFDPVVKILGLVRAELAALGVRITATEEELAAVRKRVERLEDSRAGSPGK